MSPNYYYHITQKNWPGQIKLRPRKSGEFRGYMEPSTPRICLCPTPAHCLIAVPLFDKVKKVHIYRTLQKVNVKEPVGVLDACVTLEKWRTEPTCFVKVGEVSYELYQQMELMRIVGPVWGMDRQREALLRVQRLLDWCELPRP